MSKKNDPKSNREVGQSVISPTRKYFAPTLGQTVEAADYDQAVSKLNVKLDGEQEDQEAGDGNS